MLGRMCVGSAVCRTCAHCEQCKQGSADLGVASNAFEAESPNAPDLNGHLPGGEGLALCSAGGPDRAAGICMTYIPFF